MIGAPKEVKRLGIPLDVWAMIAGYLSPIELFHFMSTTRLFKVAGNQTSVIKPICEKLYQRLRQLAPSLAPSLSEKDFVIEYKNAFGKIKVSQEEKLNEWRSEHATIVDQHFIPTKLMSLSRLQRLEAINNVLNEICIETLDMSLPPIYHITPPVITLTWVDDANHDDNSTPGSDEEPESESEIEVEQSAVTKLGKRRR